MQAIVIQDHVWIGMGSTIMPGVTIGEGAIVAARSVVMTDVAYSVVGNPASQIGVARQVRTPPSTVQQSSPETQRAWDNV